MPPTDRRSSSSPAGSERAGDPTRSSTCTSRPGRRSSSARSAMPLVCPTAAVVPIQVTSQTGPRRTSDAPAGPSAMAGVRALRSALASTSDAAPSRSYTSQASASSARARAGSPSAAASRPAVCEWQPAKATSAPLTAQVPASGLELGQQLGAQLGVADHHGGVGELARRTPTTGTSGRHATRRGRAPRPGGAGRRPGRRPGRRSRPQPRARAPARRSSARPPRRRRQRSSSGQPARPDELEPLRHPHVAGVRLARSARRAPPRSRSARSASSSRPRSSARQARRVSTSVAVAGLAECRQALEAALQRPARTRALPHSSKRVRLQQQRLRVPLVVAGPPRERDDLGRRPPLGAAAAPGVQSTSCRASRQAGQHRRVADAPARARAPAR